LVNLLKITETAQSVLDTFFNGTGYVCINLTKNGLGFDLGYDLGDFFTNLSGHPAISTDEHLIFTKSA
jgi:hypothetical protein